MKFGVFGLDLVGQRIHGAHPVHVILDFAHFHEGVSSGYFW